MNEVMNLKLIYNFGFLVKSEENTMSEEIYGKANRKRKFKHPPDVRAFWRYRYHHFIKPKREAAKKKKEGKG
jgi:hypothetical protein